MNISLLVSAGRYQSQPFALKQLGIETALHGKAGAEEAKPLEAKGLCPIAGGGYDAHQGYRRAAGYLVEHHVRRVGRQQADLCSRTVEPGNLIQQIFGQAVVLAGGQGQQLAYVDAINDDRRRGLAGTPLAVRRQQTAVVVNGGFRANPADDPDRLHSEGPLRKSLETGGK